ncbi:Homoserine O-acetyltransferase [Methylobacterium crusticola]|uniref:Homoserine O-acetyltransferase n=1 Tax=Methylobacterium crusticola TaxID=1697972 RepID=A0ABQ4RB23_9HYPH|nr:alpha/beta fold hydrolase [Methylobacterium crusticola]GJD54070.1 Homoserine O-acetyltransferase [Methylobacterium crusticola]
MRVLSLLRTATAGAALSLIALAALAADYPAPREGDWTIKGFKFHTGEILPELRLHYTTVGDPNGEPVVVLHGTTGSAASMLTPGFAGELFGPGQPLDAAKYYIIIPDAIGHGKSSKPSDGLKTKFPRYNYDDMAEAQYQLLKEHLGLKHVRLIIGNSMGGMHAWILGVKHPEFMDALIPMASQPSEMGSRNWMLRRLLIETIRRDPTYADGEYTTQPPSLRVANVFFALATSGGTLALQKQGPTGELANKLVDARLAAPFNADANDYIYQWESSRSYNPSAGLEKIEATVLAINSADDERNPPETGIMEREMKRLKSGRLYLIPASAETAGHGTTGFAKFYKQQLQEFLQAAPKRAM